MGLWHRIMSQLPLATAFSPQISKDLCPHLVLLLAPTEHLLENETFCTSLPRHLLLVATSGPQGTGPPFYWSEWPERLIQSRCFLEK